MKRLNIKLLLVSLVVVIVFGVGVFAVHAYQMSRSSDSLLKRAESAKTSGNMPQALWYYRRYLSYNPTDLQRGAECALVAADVADNAGSSEQDKKLALSLMVNTLLADRSRSDDRLKDDVRSDVRHKLIDLEMASLQLPLIAQARTLLLEMKSKGESKPDDDMRLAKCQLYMRNFSDAAKLLETVVGYDPEEKAFDSKKATGANDPDAYITLAMLLREKITDTQVPDRKELADQVIDQLIETNKDSVKAYLGEAQYLQRYYSRARRSQQSTRRWNWPPTTPTYCSRQPKWPSAPKTLRERKACSPKASNCIPRTTACISASRW